MGHNLAQDDRRGLLEANGPRLASMRRVLLQVGLPSILLPALHDQAQPRGVLDLKVEEASAQKV